MAVAVNYYKCSPELYQKYLAAGRIVDTDFYFVESADGSSQELYLGKILLSSADESIAKIKELADKIKPVALSGMIEDLEQDEFTLLIFDGGDADVTLAILDDTILE